MTVSARVEVNIFATLAKAGVLLPLSQSLTSKFNEELASTVVDKLYAAEVALVAGVKELDLNALVDAYGDAINLATLHTLYFKNKGAAAMTLGGANMCDILDGDTDSITIPPGGVFLWHDATGIAVGGTDVIPVAGTLVETFDVIIIGKA